MKFIDSKGAVVEDVGELFRVHTQELPDDFWKQLKEDRDNFSFAGDGMIKIASIPVALADHWMNQGFNVYEADVKDIIERLRLEGYDDLIVMGNKQI